ncbi:hypothetical protein FGIG_07054 [Fasciola gigantica]|uniref:Uncharacterized protein n=1 Tax=Fasciola gigantica TaxID=46835 RepID=A0A504YKP3_FASGI|nr:hypothetical protein FGIG_07054 [Fasciola gigantica]
MDSTNLPLESLDLGEDRLSFESHITLDVYSTERGTSGQQNPPNSTSYVLNLQGYVSRTRFHVFPRDCIDFGTVFLGESQHREIRLCNRSSTRAYWSITQCASLLSANNAATITLNKIKPPRLHEEYFHIIPTSGVLGSQENESGSVGVIIRFQPTKLGVFENAFVVRGIFGETEMQIHVRGQCSSDGRYRSLIGT